MLFATAVILLTAQNVISDTRLTSLRFPIVVQNNIINVTASCDAAYLNITVHMEKPFKGLLSAKDFAQECRVTGTSENLLTIYLLTSGCGVRLTANSTDGNLYYSATLVAQQDRFLRQITDQETSVRCRLRNSALMLKSEPMFEALKNEVNLSDSKDLRTGRMRTGWKKDETDENVLDKELESVLEAARVWMEISPVENHKSERVQVGEPTILSVKSTLPAGIGWRVVDCIAHDGIGEISQRLLDAFGCPLDVSILPALEMKQPKMMSESSLTAMRHQEAVASFPAFKFPDRDRLHVSCALLLCRGQCQAVNCSNGDLKNRESRRMEKGQSGEILDRLEVFNSVEVIAPGIELDDPRNSDISLDETLRRHRFPPTLLRIPGDRPFCVSPNKMALAFCILGVVFVVAVLVALVSLLRARRSGASGRFTYYSRSLFSFSSSSTSATNSGGSNYGGSKLLLQDSPTMGQTRHWRVL